MAITEQERQAFNQAIQVLEGALLPEVREKVNQIVNFEQQIKQIEGDVEDDLIYSQVLRLRKELEEAEENEGLEDEPVFEQG